MSAPWLARNYRPALGWLARLIEDQASGTALQQTLKRDGYAVRPIKPKGDKVMRMRVHTPTLEAGKVLLKKNTKSMP